MFCRAESAAFDGLERVRTPGARPLIELRQAQGQRQPAANVTVRLHAAHSAFLACKSHRSSHPAWWESVEAPFPSKDPIERAVKALAAVGALGRARCRCTPPAPVLATYARRRGQDEASARVAGVGRVSRPAYRLRRTRRTSSIPRLHAASGGFAPRSPNTAFQEALDEA